MRPHACLCLPTSLRSNRRQMWATSLDVEVSVMGLENPWERPYAALLVELRARWGIPGAEERRAGRKERVFYGSSWSYPAFVGNRRGREVMVDIAEHPFGGGDLLSGMDNSEFFNLVILWHSKLDIVIRREGWFDRFKKRVKLDWEYQTGNPEFDRSFYILGARSKADRDLLKNPAFQAGVTRLEPFETLGVIKTGLGCSIAIQDDSLFRFIFVDQKLATLTELADLIERERVK